MMKTSHKLMVVLLTTSFATSSFAADTGHLDNTFAMTTNLGEIKGAIKDKVVAFYGIPYAHNPFTPSLRFKAPQPYENWQGVLDATHVGAPVPQPGRGQTVELVGTTEDLTINIWAPVDALNSDQILPVMVWLPGGAFIREDAGEQVYEGTSFAKSNTIVVTVNYRVGVDGFMHLDGAPDNRGILDQIEALKWVQENIADFGGNPKRVTLFGQSAGAESVAILLGTDKARGLFQQAIMQSPPMQYLTAEQADRVTKALAKDLNTHPTKEGMSKVPFKQLVSSIIKTSNAMQQNRDEWGMMSWGGTVFLPVVDGVIIKKSPMKDLAENTDSSIPVIVGSTDQEARLYLVPGNTIDRVKNEEKNLFLNDLSLSGDPLTTYNPTKNKESIGDVYADIKSDYSFRMPALHIAENLVKNGNKVWHYNFSWSSPAYGGKLGAAHFVDVAFSFNTLNSAQARSFVGTHPPQELADYMHSSWSQFAHYGSAPWDIYNLTDRATMRFDTHSEQVNDPEKQVRLLWSDFSF